MQFVDRVIHGYVKEKTATFKFATAYACTTYFEKVEVEQGSALFLKAKAGDIKAYQKLQDLLVWYILRQIVRLDMVVQFHFAVTDHCVTYFDPLNLANILEDEELKTLKLVILHGGYPPDRLNCWLLVALRLIVSALICLAGLCLRITRRSLRKCCEIGLKSRCFGTRYCMDRMCFLVNGIFTPVPGQPATACIMQ